jgi:hypothetical protein
MARPVPRLPVVVAAIAAASAIAACGASSPSSSSASRSAGRPTLAQLQHDEVVFAACMRAHGAPAFPDPTSPAEFKLSLRGSSGSAGPAPAFASAEAGCAHLLPNGASSQAPGETQAHITALLAFARCLRSHGFPSFPDPTSAGHITHQMLAAMGIDLHQPAVVRAADACVGVTHGVLTRADVARFVAGQ